MNHKEYIDVAVLEMGGTINGILDPKDIQPKSSLVIEYLEKFSDDYKVKLSSEIITMKDSRALNLKDRKDLANSVLKSKVSCIHIPHGTYTMSETGMFLLENLDINVLKKSIILVGSLLPLGEPKSDAISNLSYAINQFREAPKGVWIAMNGNLWEPTEVEKDLKTGVFRSRNKV